MHNPHDVKRAAFWLILALTFGAGLLLLFYVPDHRISGALALGVITLVILKHVGLFLTVGSPLAGALKVAQVRLKRILARHGHGVS